MVLRLHSVIKDLPGFPKKTSKLPREIQKLKSSYGITKSVKNYHGEIDVFRIEGGNGTEKIRIELEPGDEAGEVKGKIWRPRHDEMKRKRSMYNSSIFSFLKTCRGVMIGFFCVFCFVMHFSGIRLFFPFSS